jgi:tetratricopeptide (TPR) repeat protein
MIREFTDSSKGSGMKRKREGTLRASTILLGLILVLGTGSVAQAGDPEALKEEGERLYRTPHLTPARFEEAIRMYEKALALQPDDYEVLWNLAKLCQFYGQSLPQAQKQKKIDIWEKGRMYGERATETNPDGKEGHFYYMSNLGSSVQIKGKLTSLWNLRTIKREMDRTLELDPDFPPALVARAQYLTQLPGLFGGDEEEAMRLYRRAVEKDPGYYIAYYYMAELDAGDGRYNEAVANLNRVIECPEQDRVGSWVTIDLPWAQKLLREIRAKQGKAP